MAIRTYNVDNNFWEHDELYDVIYADMIYEDYVNLQWIDKYWKNLKDNGVMVIQTDYHSVAEVKVHTKELPKAYFLNWLTWKNEFGNFKKDRFRQCHDDILIFCKGSNWVWYPEKIQIPKVTAKSKGLNPSGRDTKLATSVITDICLTTIANERVIKEDGHAIRWQKPLDLYTRILSPFLDEQHNKILDIYMGSGSLGKWCKSQNYDYTGLELDYEVYQLAVKNIYS